MIKTNVPTIPSNSATPIAFHQENSAILRNRDAGALLGRSRYRSCFTISCWILFVGVTACEGSELSSIFKSTGASVDSDISITRSPRFSLSCRRMLLLPTPYIPESAMFLTRSSSRASFNADTYISCSCSRYCGVSGSSLIGVLRSLCSLSITVHLPWRDSQLDYQSRRRVPCC